MQAIHNTTQNTITLKPAAPVDAATFARLKNAGFSWAKDSGAFVASPAGELARGVAADIAGYIETRDAAPANPAGDPDKWIEAARASIAQHEQNIDAALKRGDFSTADKLGGYRDKLARKIAEIENEAVQASGEAESAGTSGEENHAQASGEEIDADEAAQASGEEKTDDDTDDDGTPAELCDDIERATYSPEDNKIRLYPARRLDADIYSRVKAAGFIWAAKQGVFVAPAWTPARADLAEALAGELGDEDTTLAERAADRADRFEDYHGKRAADADSARRAVDAIAQNIPFGQPILVGHHSERHARRDAQRIEDGMRRAVKMWDTAEYWTRRAAGAIQHAKYKERPDVRARRIKTIEAAQRKSQREQDQARAMLALWDRDGMTLEQARAIAGRVWFTVSREDGHAWTAYDVLQPDGERFTACPAWTVQQVQDRARAAYPRTVAHCQRWIDHYQNRLAYERAMLEDQGAAHLLEKKTRPAPPPLLNYRAPEGFTLASRWHRGELDTLPQIDMTKAEYAALYADYRGTRTLDGHRIRSAYVNRQHVAVFLTDSKTHPRPEKAAPAADPATPDEADADQVQASGEDAQPTPSGEENHAQASGEAETAAENIAAIPEPTPTPAADAGAAFAAMRESLRAGVQVVAAPQLFPTPAGLAARMVELADIQPGERVLEPSAGTGRLLQAMPRDCVKVAIEINKEVMNSTARALRALDTLPDRFIAGDFLALDADELGTFDRVLMNPPFVNGADIQHIKHAAAMLKPGGRLVAICANGPRQRAQLMPLADTWEDLPADTFAESGTGVRAALLVIEAPGATGTDDDAGEAGQVQASGEAIEPTPSGEEWKAEGFDPTTAAGYAQITGNAAALLWWQDRLDNFFGSRLVEIRDALRGLEWSGAPNEWPLFKFYDFQPFRVRAIFDTVGAGRNVSGMAWRVEDDAGRVLLRIADDLSRTPDQIADELDAARKTPPDDDQQDADTVQASGEAQARPIRKPKKARAYEFPNAHIKIMEDGTCREFPKWCAMISVVRSRAWTADALRQLRAFDKAKRAAEASQAQASGEDAQPTPSGEAQDQTPAAPLLPGRWIPNGAENAERVACDAALGAEVWLIASTRRPGQCAVIAYAGKRTKHDAYYTMRDRERALQWAAEYMGKQQATAQRQAERRAEKAAKRAAGHKLKLGDVLRSSWGYDQTNIDYYEVTRIVGKSMVEIRAIAAESVQDNGPAMTGACVPRPGHYIGEPMRKAVSDYDGQSVRIASYASAHKIEPREVGGVKVWPVDHWTAYA